MATQIKRQDSTRTVKARETAIERRQRHNDKRRVAATYGANAEAERAMALLARELGATVIQ